MKNKIICYCAEIKANEIEKAVENNCETIEEVRLFLNKMQSGNCKEKNPTGKCCHPEFESVIMKLKR